MKFRFCLLTVLSLVFISSCSIKKSNDRVMAGSKGDPGPQGEPGQSCKSERLESGQGVRVTCGDTQVELKDGEPGISCSLQKGDPTSTLTCGGTTISLTSSPDSTDLKSCTVREEANKDKIVDCAGKVAIVHYDVCRLMSIPDHEKLKVLRCGDEYSVMKSDQSYLSFCLSADSDTVLYHYAPDFSIKYLARSNKEECFKEEKEIGSLTNLSISNIHSDTSLEFLLSMKNLTEVRLFCLESRTADLSKLAGMEQLKSLLVDDFCTSSSRIPEQPTTVVFPSLSNLKSLELVKIAADFREIGQKFPNLAELYLAGYDPFKDITGDMPAMTESLADIGLLVNLKRLNIVSDQFSDFKPLLSLKNLEQMALVNLPRLNDISFLADGSALTKLRRLQLHRTAVHDLAPLKDRATQMFPAGNVSVPFELDGYDVKFYVESKEPFNPTTCPGADATNPEWNTVAAYCSKMKKAGY